MYLEFVSQFAGEVLVALALCYLLHRSRTGIRRSVVLPCSIDPKLTFEMHRTDSMINVLIAYVVNTGLSRCMLCTVSVSELVSRFIDSVSLATDSATCAYNTRNGQPCIERQHRSGKCSDVRTRC